MRTSSRSLPFLHIAVLVLACASVTRVVLALRTGVDAAPALLWPGLLARGVLFDLLVLAWVLAPAFLWAALTPARWRRTRWARPIRLLLFCALTTGLLFVAVAEFTFWEEFSTRFNFIAVDYLVYTQEVVRNIRESYPIPLLLAAIAASALALTWVFQGPISRAPAAATGWQARLAYLVLAFALPALAWQLADIDDMAHSPNAHANELSGNGMMTFLAAFRRNELDYARFYATLPDAQAQALMREMGVPRFGPAPALLPRSVGVGLGSRSLDRPNLLRLVLADTPGASSAAAAAAQPQLQTLLVQQAQIDDATPEDLAHLAALLRQAGAVEVYSQSIAMKKGRQGQLLTVHGRPEQAEALRQVWWQHSSSLGLRETLQQRWVLPRRSRTLDTPLGPVRIKQAQRPDGRWRSKIEHDDLVALAARHRLALAEVRAVVDAQLASFDQSDEEPPTDGQHA